MAAPMLQWEKVSMRFIDGGKNSNINIKSWCKDLEDGALEQAKNLAHHPVIRNHVALMADCLSNNTEVLTSCGFKLISELSYDDKVANYDPDDGKIYFMHPTAIINRPLRKDEKVFEFISTFLDKNIVVTENHRMTYKPYNGKHYDTRVLDIPDKTFISHYIWSGNGIKKSKTDTNKPYLDIQYELLCLIAWVVGDGNLKKNNKKPDGTFSSIIIRFGLTKERKINRIIQLLTSLGYTYNIRIDNQQTSIEIHTKYSAKIIEYIGVNKEYPVDFITSLSDNQATILLEEILKVDGDWLNYQKTGAKRYNSKRTSDVNFISSLIAIHTGIANDNTRLSEGYQNIKMHYLSSIDKNNVIESGNGIHNSILVKNQIDYSDNVVCLSCDSGFFIARQNGLTFVTGNCHQGYGMPIGGVIACHNAVIPNAVGVDIGCGMCAVRTTLTSIKKQQLREIINKIKLRVPMGEGHAHAHPQEWTGMDTFKKSHGYSQTPEAPPIMGGWYNEKMWELAKRNLGTLGGGNHFIEIQAGDDGFVWIMLHSGSRNLGYQIAKHWNDTAKELNKQWHSVLPCNDLAFLPTDSVWGVHYIYDMNFALAYAEENRTRMMQVVKTSIAEIFNDVKFGMEVNIHHNYATIENHFGKNLWIHRKGATSAKLGQFGIIPGAMGSFSYIVKGLGNEQSFKSCSHGAGRTMSRTQASATFSKEECDTAMDGIVWDGFKRSRGRIKRSATLPGTRYDLSEAPQAYKNIDEVMEAQKDLVEPVVKLRTLAVLKG